MLRISGHEARYWVDDYTPRRIDSIRNIYISWLHSNFIISSWLIYLVKPGNKKFFTDSWKHHHRLRLPLKKSFQSLPSFSIFPNIGGRSKLFSDIRANESNSNTCLCRSCFSKNWAEPTVGPDRYLWLQTICQRIYCSVTTTALSLVQYNPRPFIISWTAFEQFFYLHPAQAIHSINLGKPNWANRVFIGSISAALRSLEYIWPSTAIMAV